MRLMANAKTDHKPGALALAIRQQFGWRKEEAGPLTVWFKGYGRVQDTARLIEQLSALGSRPGTGDLSRLAMWLDGHFALVAQTPDWTLAAVDRVRSIPVAFAKGPEGWIVNGQAGRLREKLGLTTVNDGAALALAMSGYTIDRATLFEGVEQLGPGEFVLFRPDERPLRHRYYCYRPWRADKPAYDAEGSRRALAETTLSIIDAMMKSIGDRILVVPLSAGRDSRLIVSAAHHLGYRNILTFAYGRKGNHEAQASKEIAERLGFKWRFVPTDTKFMRDYFSSSAWGEYCRFADTLQSVPFVQDLPQIQVLKGDGYIPDDAVFANGNSGDFISGNHVIAPIDEVPDGFGAQQRRERIVKTLCSKHFSLWDALRTPENTRTVRGQINASINREGIEFGDPADDYGIYEYAEFQDRQCKYVITGQRIYEFLGHEWRLPLWDNALLDFFEGIPLEGKREQNLFARTLDEENWGGVWKGVPVNRKTIRPGWVRPLRWAAKAVHAPLGREKWHAFEKRYFGYWIEQGSQSAIRPYGDVARDTRGARHGIAWLTEAYLHCHDIPLEARTSG